MTDVAVTLLSLHQRQPLASLLTICSLMPEQQTGGIDRGCPGQGSNETFRGITAGGAVVQLSVRGVVGKALGGKGECAARTGDEDRRIDRRRGRRVQPVVRAAEIEAAGPSGMVMFDGLP